jgi:hypothetical protein
MPSDGVMLNRTLGPFAVMLRGKALPHPPPVAATGGANVSNEGGCIGTYIRAHQTCEGSLKIARGTSEDSSAALGESIALQHAVVDTGCGCTTRVTRTCVAATVYRISVVALIGEFADQSFAGVSCIRT